MNRRLLRRLEALEDRRSAVSPYAVQAAQSAYRERGELPSDPRVRQLVQGMEQARREIDAMMHAQPLEDSGAEARS